MSRGVQVGTKRRTKPLVGYAVGSSQRAQRHQVYVKERWADTDWLYVPYANATKSVERGVSQRSVAQITYEYGNIKREDDNSSVGYKVFGRENLRNLYVAILALPSDSSSGRGQKGVARPVTTWVGMIPAEQMVVDGNQNTTSNKEPSGRQVYQATWFEYLLERRRVDGAIRDHVAVPGEPPNINTWDHLSDAPGFNQRRKDGRMSGNRSASKITTTPTSGIETSYVFSDATDSNGIPYQWSLSDILEYLLYWSAPLVLDPTGREPSFILDGLTVESGPKGNRTATDYLAGVVEAINSNDKSVWEVIKKVFSRSRGVLARYAYNIGTDRLPTSDPIHIKPFTMTDIGIKIGEAQMPANKDKVDIVIDEGVDVGSASLTMDSMNRYDEIIVQGAKMVVNFSAWTNAYPEDTNLPLALDKQRLVDNDWNFAKIAPGWTPAHETQYENDPEGRTNDSNLNKVFREFVLVGSSNTSITPFDWRTALATASDASRNLNPAFDDDARVNFNINSGYLNANKRFLRELPIDSVASTSGETVEKTKAKMSVYVELLDHDGEGSNIWVEGSNPPDRKEVRALFKRMNGYNAGNPQYKDLRAGLGKDMPLTITPLSADLRFKITGGSHSLALAKNHLSQTVGRKQRKNTSYDYDKMIVTLALESDTRPAYRVKVKNSIAAGTISSRRLIITREDIKTAYVAPHTVIGVTSPGDLIFSSGLNFTRDDRYVLASLAAFASAWYSKDRLSVVVEKNGVQKSAQIGYFIRTVMTKPPSASSLGAHTPVTEIAIDYDAQTTTLTTGTLELDIAGIRNGNRRQAGAIGI